MSQRCVEWMMVAFVVAVTSSVLATDLTGTWLGTTEIPDRGTDRVTLVLRKDANGFSGTIGDSMELIAKDTAIADVNVDGNVLTFAFPLADGVRVVVKLEFEGDRGTGSWATSEGNMGTLSFEKQKK